LSKKLATIKFLNTFTSTSRLYAQEAVVMGSLTQSNPNTQLFKLSLERLIYQLTLYPPRFAQAAHEIVKTIAHADESTDQGRVWWRMPSYSLSGVRDDKGTTGYVSLNPGEFRVEPPVGPGNIIREIPVQLRTPTLLQRLEQMAQTIKQHQVEQGGELEFLLKRTENVLNASRSESEQSVLEEFWAAAFGLTSDQNLSVQQIEQRLFEDYLHSGRMDVVTFCNAILLAGFQMRVSKWYPIDGFKSAGFALSVYLRWASLEDPLIVDLAVQAGNFHFDSGEEMVKQALSALTLRDFYRKLFLAAHHYFCARVISFDISQRINPPSFDYESYIAEEGWAGVITGLCDGVEEMLDIGQPENIELILIRFLQNDQEEEVKKYVRDLTRPRNPIFPRHYAYVALARAMINAEGKWLEPGVRKLLDLEKEFMSRATISETASDELDNIYHGLARGYYLKGDEEQARSFGRKLVARKLTRHVLSEWSGSE